MPVKVDPLFGDTTASAAPTLPAVTPPSLPPIVAPTIAVAMLPSDGDIDTATATSSGGQTITDKILATHKNHELGEMGANLNKLLATAKGLNPQGGHGVFDVMLTRIHGEREQLLARLQSTKTRMQTLRTTTDRIAALHRERVRDLEGIKAENAAHLDQMRAAIDRLAAWEPQVDAALAVPPDQNDPHAATHLADLRHRRQRIVSTTENLRNACILSQQRGVELQEEQDVSRGLVDQYAMAKDLAIVALEGMVVQQLIALEQRNALQVEQGLRDVIHGAIIQTAQALGENQVQIATAQNTPIIALADLERAQAILEQSATKVREIETKAAADRAANATRRAELQRRLLA